MITWFKNRRQWWPAAALLGIVIIWFFLGQRPVTVTYALAHQGPMKLAIAASGKVDGDASDLSFIGSGTIIEQYAKEGDSVKKGQLLARINRTDLVGSDDVIQAPFDGSVVAVYRKIGSAAGPATPVMRVVQRGSVYVTAYLDSEDAAWVKPGARFECRAGGYLARAWPLRVESIGQEAVPREDVAGSARQVRAQMAVLSPDFSLPIGTSVDVDGEVPIAQSVLQIPASAIVRDEAHTFVWRIRESRVEQARVTLGPNNFRYVAITSGLGAGDRVVLGGKTDLKVGQTVSAQPWEESQP